MCKLQGAIHRTAHRGGTVCDLAEFLGQKPQSVRNAAAPDGQWLGWLQTLAAIQVYRRDYSILREFAAELGFRVVALPEGDHAMDRALMSAIAEFGDVAREVTELVESGRKPTDRQKLAALSEIAEAQDALAKVRKAISDA